MTDVAMSRMRGLHLCHRLSARRPGLQVLYMSGHTRHAMIDEQVLSLGLPFLQKLFSPSCLALRVTEVLNEAESGEEA